MSPDIQVLLSGALTFGAPLALAIHELIALRRPPRGGEGRRPPELAPKPKPLPDCLIPRPSPGRVRTRELEDA